MNPIDTPHSQNGGDSLRLSDLPAGASAEVLEVDPGSPSAGRLLDLGFTPRTRVRAVQRAPLGDPMVWIKPKSKKDDEDTDEEDETV